jgi:hypothetical protein
MINNDKGLLPCKSILFFYTLLVMLFLVTACGNSGYENDSQQQVFLDSAYYMEQGHQITQKAFDTLSQSLQKAIAENGMIEALTFCNVHALSITKSAASDEIVELKRTALRYRNPENAPTELERQILNGYLKSFDKGDVLQNQVLFMDGAVHFFRPIKLMPMCTNCHGTKDNISPEVLSKINQLYPNDQAIDFYPNELRGMWHLKFRK